VLLVCTALIAQASSWGSAINLLIQNDQSDAVGPLQRALHELWVEFRYLMRDGEASRNAQLLAINATFEVTDFARKYRRQFDHASLKRIVRTLRSYKRESPTLYERIVSQRRARRFHWSGLSRTKLAGKFSPDAVVYKGLSWEAHAVLGAVRDIEISEGDGFGRFQYRPMMGAEDSAEQEALMAGRILYNLWNEFASAFSLPIVSI
jgi:hypothetical protein